MFTEIFYDKNDDGTEVDFLIRKGTKPVELIQVAASLRNAATYKREVTALLKSMDKHGLQKATIVTLEEEKVIRDGKRRIRVVPAVKWLAQK
jgi:predicted AAA+ superfamily ATPase